MRDRHRVARWLVVTIAALVGVLSASLMPGAGAPGRAEAQAVPRFIFPTSGYIGYRWHEPEQQHAPHAGLDIWTGDDRASAGKDRDPGPCGNEVRAAYPGTVYGVYTSLTGNDAWKQATLKPDGKPDPQAGIVVLAHHGGLALGMTYDAFYTMYLHMAVDGGKDDFKATASCVAPDLIGKLNKEIPAGYVLGRQGNLRLSGDKITHLHFEITPTLQGQDAIDFKNLLGIDVKWDSPTILSRGAGMLYTGQKLQGSIDDKNDADASRQVYFLGEAGEQDTLRLARRGSQFRGGITVKSSGGAVLGHADISASGGDAVVNNIKLPAQGTYIVELSAAPGSRGGYTLGLEKGGGTSVGDRAKKIENGIANTVKSDGQKAGQAKKAIQQKVTKPKGKLAEVRDWLGHIPHPW